MTDALAPLDLPLLRRASSEHSDDDRRAREPRALSRRAFLAAGIVSLAGCASRPPLDTPSGRPEVVIPNTTRKAVLDRIVAAKLERGGRVRTAHEYGVTIGNSIEQNAVLGALFGSGLGPPEMRVTYSVVDVEGGAVRVFTRSEIVTSPGTAFERVLDMTTGLNAEMQAELIQLRDKLAGG